MHKRNAGFSLVEVLVAIVLLGAMVVPIGTGLVTSLRINDKTESMLQAQLDVSSAVERLMATGVTTSFLGELTETEDPEDGNAKTHTAYPDVIFVIGELQEEAYYQVQVTDEEGLVSVVTSIRKEGT